METPIIRSYEIKMIPMLLLHPFSDNEITVSVPDDDINALAQNIEICGLITPLTVVARDNSDGVIYEIVHGLRRFFALQKICETYPDAYATVPCHVIFLDDFNDISLIRIFASSQYKSKDNRDKQCFEVIHAYESLATQGTIDSRAIPRLAADMLGITDRYARMYRDIFNNATSALQSAVISERKKSSDCASGPIHIPVHIASMAANDLPEAQQDELVNRVNAGEPAELALNSLLLKKSELSSNCSI